MKMRPMLWLRLAASLGASGYRAVRSKKIDIVTHQNNPRGRISQLWVMDASMYGDAPGKVTRALKLKGIKNDMEKKPVITIHS